MIATMALGLFGLTSEAALAAKNETYAQKKAGVQAGRQRQALRDGAFSLPEKPLGFAFITPYEPERGRWYAAPLTEARGA